MDMKRKLYGYGWSVAVLLTGIALLGGCTKDPLGAERGTAGEDSRRIELYIPAPEEVTVYGAATENECRIENVAVLTWDKAADKVKGAEEVKLILGNRTQNPTLQLANLFPERGDHVIVVANYDGEKADVEGCVGLTLRDAREKLPSENILRKVTGQSGLIGSLLLMAGEKVWGEDTSPVKMRFQVVKLSVEIAPELLQEGGPLADADKILYSYYHTKYDTQWATESLPADPVSNTQPAPAMTIRFSTGLPEVDEAAYLYDQIQDESNDPIEGRTSIHGICLHVARKSQELWEHYFLTTDELDANYLVKTSHPFEAGKHYTFRIRNIYKRGYYNGVTTSTDRWIVLPCVAMASEQPSNVVYDIEVSDDWSKYVEYNGQFALTTDRDTAYVFATDHMQEMFRFSWPQPEGNTEGAPTQSTVKLVDADGERIDIEEVCLTNETGQALFNNYYTFMDEVSPEGGRPVWFKAKSNPGKAMFVEITLGNISKRIPVGWQTLSLEQNSIDFKGGSVKLESSASFGTQQQTLHIDNVEFSEDGGQTWDKTPSWIRYDEDGKQLTVDAQNGLYDNAARQTLQAAAEVSDYNLSNSTGASSVENTANCYVVNAPGTYRLPLVYGNAIKNGAENPAAYTSKESPATLFMDYLNSPISSSSISSSGNPKDACLIWQEAKGLVTDIRLSDDRQFLTFRVPRETIQQGNALVSVRDDQGRIMWTWHIWVTDYKLDSGLKTVRHPEGHTYELMPINLGWCDPAQLIYDARKCLVRLTAGGATATYDLEQTAATKNVVASNLLYQWGRNEPMRGIYLAGSGSFAEKDCWSDFPEYQFVSIGMVHEMTRAEMIQEPYKQGSENIIDRNDSETWNSSLYGNGVNEYFQVVKTIYDPSPRGYSVMPGAVIDAFLIPDGKDYYKLNSDGPYQNGFYLYCDQTLNTETIFFPFTGYRYGQPYDKGNAYWTCSMSSKTGVFGLIFNKNGLFPPNRGYVAECAEALRIMKEQ